MFDLPDAKRIRRSDLYTRSQSASPSPSEPDPQLEAQFRARLASIYGPPTPFPQSPIAASTSQLSAPKCEDDVVENEPEQEFEFRLFSTTAPGRTGGEEDRPTQRIILIDKEEHIGDGGFVVRERNRGYYFAQKAYGERKLGLEVMALSGEEVLRRATKRAWGLEVPWRVRVLKAAGNKINGEVGEPADAVVGVDEKGKDWKKKKTGKTRRIIMRERKKIKENLELQKMAETEKREEAERDKRTRRNREKKAKRKMKEKAKKASGTAEDDEDSVMVAG